jgi:4-aminobutyrate aminotransferase
VNRTITVETALGSAPNIRTPLPGPKARDFIERDERYSSTAYTRDYPLVAERASGCVVEDVDGNRFLDFAAGIAVCATGHCHPEVVAAITEQANKLIHLCGSDFYYPPMVEVIEKLVAISPIPGGKKVFLTNSGAEAVEGAFKLARFHTRRKWVIAFHGGFHGRTMGALSLTSSKAIQQAGFGPLVPMVAHVPYGSIEAIETQLFSRRMLPDEVAAVFVEALQGEGGYVVPSPDFLPRLRGLCDRNGILLVLDEIQSGMGRTGKWWACEHFGIAPDILLSAKGIASGMPLGAIIAREELVSWPPGAHGSTFGGNPVSCAAALATIRLIESGYMSNAERLGVVVRRKLEQIATNRACIANVRGLGMMNAVDVVHPATGKPDPRLRAAVLQTAFRHGLILLGCGDRGIRFCPPLCVTEQELETGLALFDAAAAGAMVAPGGRPADGEPAAAG